LINKIAATVVVIEEERIVKFTVIENTRYGESGAVLGTVEAEDWCSASKKAKRIEQSSKSCPWRGHDWVIKECNTPFKNSAKMKRLVRKARRRVDNKYSEDDWMRDKDSRHKTVGGYKIRARNGTISYD
jgi:hypothetical protein